MSLYGKVIHLVVNGTITSLIPNLATDDLNN